MGSCSADRYARARYGVWLGATIRARATRGVTHEADGDLQGKDEAGHTMQAAAARSGRALPEPWRPQHGTANGRGASPHCGGEPGTVGTVACRSPAGRRLRGGHAVDKLEGRGLASVGIDPRTGQVFDLPAYLLSPAEISAQRAANAPAQGFRPGYHSYGSVDPWRDHFFPSLNSALRDLSRSRASSMR
jgi:hypothetical protein